MTSRAFLFKALEEAEWNWCSYDPGDVAVVHPKASPVDVDSFLTTMGWSNVADDPILLHQVFEGSFTSANDLHSLNIADQSLPDHLPRVSTLRSLFTSHLDINAVPKRSFFRLLEHFAADEREREKLKELSSPEGAVDVPLISPGRSSAYARTGGVVRLCNESPSHDPRGGRRVPFRARTARLYL